MNDPGRPTGTRALNETAASLIRDPQPASSLLDKPTHRILPVAVRGFQVIAERRILAPLRLRWALLLRVITLLPQLGSPALPTGQRALTGTGIRVISEASTVATSA